MENLIYLIAVISAISLFFNVGYIIHELGWYPHTKDRSRPKEKFGIVNSKFIENKVLSHDYQVLHSWNYDLRRLGHKEIYDFKDPSEALNNVMRRYEEDPTRSKYDDLVHLSNHISNHVKCDDNINVLIDKIAELTIRKPCKN